MEWQEEEIYRRYDRLAARIAEQNENYTDEEISADVEAAIKVCRDKDDDKFLENGVSGNADYLVTYDSDLLSLNPYRNIPFITPAEIWPLLEN